MRFWFGLATAPLVWSEVDDDTVALLQGRRNVIEAGERQADDREAVVVDNLDQTAAKKGPPPRPPPPQRPVAPPPPVPKPAVVDPVPPNVAGLHNGGCPAQNTFCANQLNWPPNCDVPVAGCPDNWNMGACQLDQNAKFPAGLMCHDPHVVNVTRSSARTQAKYAAVAASVVELVESISTSCTNEACPQTEFSACVLRMSGHDFMDFDGSNGGSDGCVDFNDPDNNGLKPCLVNGELVNGQRTHTINLNKAFAAHAASVSLADFLVIAGEAVMAHERHNETFDGGKNLGDEFKKRFQWGRITNHNCGHQKELPLPQESCAANEKTFVNQQTGLGLSWRETAALMGVHSLGRAREANSGYDGWWSDFKSAGHFNNNYYHSLALKGWTPFQLKSGKWQWIRSGRKSKMPGRAGAGLSDEMMLNTDMCLLYKFANGEDIKAEPQASQPGSSRNQSCCAWLMPGAFTSHGQSPGAAVGHVQNKIDNNQWCGFPAPSGGFFATKHWCCQEGQVRVGGAVTDCNDMAGGGAHGVAAADVLEFAANEDAWINTFLDAWNKATQKGM